MKDFNKKIRCECGCPTWLYISLDDKGTKNETLFIGSELLAIKSFKNFKGVLINRKKLLNLLK